MASLYVTVSACQEMLGTYVAGDASEVEQCTGLCRTIIILSMVMRALWR